MTRSVCIGLVVSSTLLACAPPPTRRSETVYADPAPKRVDAVRWVLEEASCADREEPLSDLQAELRITSRADGSLALALDRTCGACSLTTLYQAHAHEPCGEPGCSVTLSEEARAALGGEACLGRPDTTTRTKLRWGGRTLALTVRSEELCRGFDLRMRFSASPLEPLAPKALVRHFVAEWNRARADDFAALFAPDGELVVPFEQAETIEHRGRAAIAAWFRDQVAARPWAALRAIDMGQRDRARYTLRWEYLDPALDHPVRGAVQLVLGGGLIDRAELWIDPRDRVVDAKPRATPEQ